MSTNEPLVPIEAVAKHFAVSVSTVRVWLRQGLIPQDSYIKVAGTYRFDISKMVAGLTSKPKDDVQVTAPVPAAPTPEAEEPPVQLELDFSNPDNDA